MAATKVAIRRQHSGSFGGDQAQLQAQRAAAKTNAHVDAISVLNNRAYTELAIDVSINGTAGVFTDLISANINTLLTNGFLIITMTMSGARPAGTGSITMHVLVDGVLVKGSIVTTTPGAGFAQAIMARVAVRKGAHVVKVQWSTDVNSARINAKTASTQEHLDLLVQEAA